MIKAQAKRHFSTFAYLIRNYMNCNNIYEQKFKILSFLIDNKSQLKPYYLLSYLQEVAWAHVNEYNIGWDYLNHCNKFWAIIRYHIIIERMPKWNEEVILQTWGKPYGNLLQPRDFEMIDSNKNIIIRATSSWVILDKTTGKPQKLDDYKFKYFENKEKNAIFECAPKIEKTNFFNSPVIKQVVYSDLDINQHVNNARYFQWTMDEFSSEFHMKYELKEIFVNYIAQAKSGESYAVNYQEIKPGTFNTLIFSPDDNREFCRIKTIWNPK